MDNILEDFDPPEVLKKYYPGGLVGHDKEGCPVWIVPLGNLDIKGLFHAAKKTDFIRYTVRCLQQSEEDMKQQSEKVSQKEEEETLKFKQSSESESSQRS